MKSFSFKVLAVIFAVPVVITFAVGADRLVRALSIGSLNLPSSGMTGVFVGLCVIATAWIAWQGLSALWRKA